MTKLKKQLASKNATLIAVLVVVIVVSCLLNPNYLGKDNIGSILNTMSLAGTLAVGLGCLIISGQINLAAGAEGCLGGLIAAMLIRAGLPWPAALVFALLYGVVAGLITSYLCNVLNFTAFIVTIAMQSVYKGIGLALTNSQNVAINNQSFWEIGSTMVFGVIPLPFVIMVALFIIYGLILSYTRFGRKVYMCGGNSNAARLAGINPKKIHTALFINCSVISALGGVILSARMHSASPSNVFGTEFDAITGAVLGGIAFTGGSGGMFGCFLGLLLLSCFNNGMVGAGLQSYWSIVARGVLLVIALAIDYFRELSRRNALKASAVKAVAGDN